MCDGFFDFILVLWRDRRTQLKFACHRCRVSYPGPLQARCTLWNQNGIPKAFLASKRFKGNEEANAILNPAPRKGWEAFYRMV